MPSVRGQRRMTSCRGCISRGDTELEARLLFRSCGKPLVMLPGPLRRSYCLSGTSLPLRVSLPILGLTGDED